MKQTIFLALIFAATILQAQNLSDIYKNGTVNLVPDKNYGQSNDWDKLFADRDETAFGRQTGLNKRIVVAPDGSVFMSHHTRHSISKFDKNGNFVKEFGKKGGKNPADFIYMPLQTTPVKNGNIAIMGHVAWKNGVKYIISILNFNTEKEKIIHSEISTFGENGNKMRNISSYFYTNDKGEKKNVSFISMGPEFMSGFIFRERFATTKDGNLVIGYPKTGLVKIMDASGNILKQFNAVTEPEVITSDDREQYYQNALKKVAQIKSEVVKTPEDEQNWDKYIAQFQDRIDGYRDSKNYPANLPYFSEMLIDSDNNILLFRFTRQAGSNCFDVYTYDNTGKKIATSSFVTEESYDLKINPAVFAFHNGSIYSWLHVNDVEKEGPMRLVKFNVGKK